MTAEASSTPDVKPDIKPETSQIQKVQIIVTYNDRPAIKFATKTTSKFAKVFEGAEKVLQMQPGTLRFRYRGVSVRGAESVADRRDMQEDLADGEDIEIEAFVEQIGG